MQSRTTVANNTTCHGGGGENGRSRRQAATARSDSFPANVNHQDANLNERRENARQKNKENMKVKRQLPLHSQMLHAVKRTFDIFGALTFFVFFGWLYLIVAMGVLITSGRPVLFWQQRYGKGGRIFPFYKFRSMVPDAEAVLKEYLKSNPSAAEEWRKYQKLDDDPRITRFGKFIRKTSLDELPQFWNVLRGDMSLIGPRPCLLMQKNLYGSYWGHYTAVRPGITGLWQVSGRNTVSYRRRVALDVHYVESLSLRQDLYIFLKTIWVVITGHGSK